MITTIAWCLAITGITVAATLNYRQSLRDLRTARGLLAEVRRQEATIAGRLAEASDILDDVRDVARRAGAR